MKPRFGKMVFALVGSVTVLSSAMGDEGMWPTNKPPLDALSQRYGFVPSAEWLTHLQRSCTRIGRGASGSIISPHGLVLTNHHVGSGQIRKLSTPTRDLLKDGFLARTRDDELKCKDLEINVLQSIEEVTDRVTGAAQPGMSAGQGDEARSKMIAQIESESEAATGLNSVVVTFYHGAQYHLYRYKRFDDIRLVWAPEQQAAFFGADNDNFEYPRFNLDACLMRIYADGKPLETADYLRWNPDGAADGELVFVVGHPYRTQRLHTVEHLKHLRDVEIPTMLRRFWRREVELISFSQRSKENARIASGQFHGVQNSRKAFTGILAGLHDPAIMRGKVNAQEALLRAVNANPDYKAKWASAWSQVAQAQRDHGAIYERFSALEGRRRVFHSQLMSKATKLVRLAAELQQPSTERLKEYRDSALDALYLDLYSTAPIYKSLEIDGIASGLSYLAETFGAEDPLVVKALAGQSPRARARAVVNGTHLEDVGVRRRLASEGTAGIAASSDTMIQFVAIFEPEISRLRELHQEKVKSVEDEAYAKIAAAQFAINGEDLCPDANSTLRLSYGPIRGYEEDGKDIPPFTTLGGMYERAENRSGEEAFRLPESWRKAKEKLNLDTPFNFVCTADIIGGNSGSPVVNRKGEVIGLVFDGNLQGLVWDVAYTDYQARAVAVDVRAMIEALRTVYHAGHLVDEILGG